MRQHRKNSITAVLLLLVIVLLAGCQKTEQTGSVTVSLTEDTDVVLHNPDMGWVIYDNYIINPSESAAFTKSSVYGYDFPGVDAVMLKFTWADIERKPDVYEFAKFDYIYDYWTERGKKVVLGMSTESLLWYGMDGRGIPQYVLDALPDTSKYKRSYTGNVTLTYMTCDANEPYYQERLTLFLQAFSSHMKETGRVIDYIDLRGFGLWGEWHSGYPYEADRENLMIVSQEKRQALDAILQIWTRAFPDAWLALSYSWDPDEPAANYRLIDYYDEYVTWSALDLALNYSNITFRRDGCGGPTQGALQASDRKFCEQTFADLCRGPFTSEAAQGYDTHANAEASVMDGLTLHPNWFTVIGWGGSNGRAFLDYEPELFNYGLRNMGYRFVATSMTYPRSASVGGSITVSGVWKNTAVGRSVRNYELIAVLTQNGKDVCTFSLGDTDCSKWIKGSEYSCSVTGTVPTSVKPGKYTLNIAMYDRQTNQYIGLAIKQRDGDNLRYTLGEIKVN